jgi:hypothetical protein
MMADPPPPPRPARRCAVCGKAVAPDSRFRPFCSARCRQVDLGRWLAGDYAIPVQPEDQDGEDV